MQTGMFLIYVFMQESHGGIGTDPEVLIKQMYSWLVILYCGLTALLLVVGISNEINIVHATR